MAESVDALVSNTNDSNIVPVRPRLWVHSRRGLKQSSFFAQFSYILYLTDYNYFMSVMVYAHYIGSGNFDPDNTRQSGQKIHPVSFRPLSKR